MTFAPADPDSGITFIRDQDEKVATIPALVGNVLKRPRRTCLRNGTLHVETVEHCLAALSGLGITGPPILRPACGCSAFEAVTGLALVFLFRRRRRTC